MKLKVYYSLSEDKLGRKIDYSGARYIVDTQVEYIQETIADEFCVPLYAVTIEHIAEVLY